MAVVIHTHQSQYRDPAIADCPTSYMVREKGMHLQEVVMATAHHKTRLKASGDCSFLMLKPCEQHTGIMYLQQRCCASLDEGNQSVDDEVDVVLKAA